MRRRVVSLSLITAIALGFSAMVPVAAHGPGDNHGTMGTGYGMGPGMMGQGYGMMGPGMMGPGMMWRPGGIWALPQDLTKANVEHMLGHQLAWSRNPNLKPGKVEEKDADTIVADIVGKDGSVVERLEFDRHTGWSQPVPVQ